MEIYMNILEIMTVAISAFVALAGIKCCMGIYVSFSIREADWKEQGVIYECLEKVEKGISMSSFALIMFIVIEIISSLDIAALTGMCALIDVVLMIVRQNMMKVIKAEEN